MKVKLTTSIDPKLKLIFEATSSLHGKTFVEALEQGVRQIIENVSEIDGMKLAIAQKQEELEELQAKLMELEVLKRREQSKAKKEQQQDQTSDYEKYLEEYRTAKFEDGKEAAVRLWERGDLNWKRIVPSYQFSCEKEAKEWFMLKVMEYRRQGAIK